MDNLLAQKELCGILVRSLNNLKAVGILERYEFSYEVQRTPIANVANVLSCIDYISRDFLALKNIFSQSIPKPASTSEIKQNEASPVPTELPDLSDEAISDNDSEAELLDYLDISKFQTSVDDSNSRNAKVASPLSCNVCKKLYFSKLSLQAHLKSHDNQMSASEVFALKNFDSKLLTATQIHVPKQNRLFQCLVCNKRFAQKSTLNVHTAQHTGSFNFRCRQCPKTYANQSKLNFHMHSHRPPRFVCEFCGKKFIRRDVLKNHVKSCHNTLAQVHRCFVCYTDWPSQADLNSHCKSHVSDFGLLRCAPCDPTLDDVAGHLLHAELHPPSALLPRPETSCGRACPSREVLDGQDQKLKCHDCGQAFTLKYNLEAHKKTHLILPVEETKPHGCSLCPKRFSRKARLAAHVKMHNQDPSYACDVCSKTFFRLDCYKKHKFLHTNVHPYTCDSCGKTFAFKSSMRSHAAKHSSVVKETNFQCDVCGQKFKHKTSMVAHLKAHRGESKFECSVCHKKFMRKSGYVSHMHSHSNSRPHRCPACNKGFKEKKHCREHLKRMHPSEFNVEALFASITTEDEHIAEMLHTVAPTIEWPL